MKETRIFLELIKSDNGEMFISVGGGTRNDGQLEFHDNIASAIKDFRKRTYESYDEFEKEK